MSTSGVGPIDQSLLPAEIRRAPEADRERYTAALGFERLLVQQLAASLAKTAQPSEEEGASAATSTYRGMLPDALADAVTQSGGLGVAQAIYQQLDAGREPTA